MPFCGTVLTTHHQHQQQQQQQQQQQSQREHYGSSYSYEQQQQQQQQQQPSNSMNRSHSLEREHSNFGDGYSLHSSLATTRSEQQGQQILQADYDHGATDLYRAIENKDWDAALHQLETTPIQAKTWVFRTEHGHGSKTRWKLLPLHAVCIFRAPLALIEALIEVYPDGPQKKDDQGMLPVHLACRNGASKGVVLTLLNAYPDSIRTVDRKDRSPADLVASSQSANKDAVLAAIERFRREAMASGYVGGSTSRAHSVGGHSTHARSLMTPSAGLAGNNNTNSMMMMNEPPEVDYDHRTTLFRLILKKDWKAAAARALSFPDEAATWIVTKGFHGNLRFLPLHKACVLQPPESVVQALLNSYPAAAKDKDQDGWLPVHCACFYGAQDRVVHALLQAHAKGAATKDDEGRLPLHYACLKGASKDVTDVLLTSYGKGAMIKDDEGRLPIHHACSKGAPETIIEALLKANPKAAQSKDDQGRVALHHACRKKAPERVVRTLLRVYPRAAQIKDDQEKLPVHYACQQGSPGPVVSLLLHTYPESVYVENSNGRTPATEVKALDNAKFDYLLKLLEKSKREQDKIKARNNKNSTNENSTSHNNEQKIADLKRHVEHLEKTLGKVTILGREIKADVKRRKDPTEILEKFAQALIELGTRTTAGSSGKTPLKGRQSTPLKGKSSHHHNNERSGGVGGLFGRRKSHGKAK